MKSQAQVAKDTLWRVGAVFLILWLIAAVTDILGTYEYEVQFLQLAVGFYLLSRIPTAFRSRYSTSRKIQKFFTNLGWPLVGLWILFKIVRWIGWFGALDIDINIDYMLVAGIVLLLIGYAVKSLRYKAGYWAVRSVLFAVGGVSFLFWILIHVFSIFPEYSDYALVCSIVAIGLGFVLGGLKKPPTFMVDVEEEEPEPEISDEVHVLSEDVSIARNKARVKLNKGSLVLPITARNEIGAIYFGEGSYSVDASIKVYSDVYRGVTVVSGKEWDSVKAEQDTIIADEKAFEDIGLKKEEVLEIARLQVQGKMSEKVRKKLKNVKIDLPFIKIRETPRGEYVKVGPIEVEDTKDEEHVRIGSWEFRESSIRKRLTEKGLFIKIRSKNEDITISSNGRTVLTKGDMQISVNDRVVVRGEEIDLVMDEEKKVLHAGNVKLICREDRRVLHSDGFELIVRESSGKIKKKGKYIKITDEKMLQEIRTEIDAAADELIREVLDQGELKELDALIAKFEQELG